MLRVSVHRRIDDIDPARWDGVGNDPFSSHRVLSSLEAAGMEGVRFRYAVVEDRGRVIACIPYARLAVDGAHLTRGLFRWSIDAVRHPAPNFMRTSLCVCGIPLSVGSPPLRITPDVDARPVWREAAGLLSEIADEEGAPWRSIKEMRDGDREAEAALAEDGWLLVPSEPNCRLTIRWRTFDTYLQSLRHPYRYKIHKSARKMSLAGVCVDVVPLADAYNEGLHCLYQDVVARAAVRLERLTPAFFLALGRSLKDRARLIRFIRSGHTIGWVAVLIDGDRIYDLFHGIDYAENPLVDLYFNQLAETIRFACDRRARLLSLGQSTEAAKTRFGAELAPLKVAVRHRSEVINTLLRRGARSLFPEKTIDRRNVFNIEPTAAEGIRS